MLKLKVKFNISEAIFEDDLFCGYRFLKTQDKIFDDWFDVNQFIQDGFTAEIKYEVVDVRPIDD